MKHLLSLTIIVLIMGGCGSILPTAGEPTRKYTLGYTTVSEDVNELKIHLLVDNPSVYAPLDSTRIALMPTERSIDYYADAEWANRLGLLIQESIIYSLENTKKLASVNRPADGAKVSKVLKVEVRGFNMDLFSQPPYRIAQVDYLIQIADMPSRQVVAAESFRSKIQVNEEKMDAFVQGLNQAHLEATGKMIKWTLKKLKELPQGSTDEGESEKPDENKNVDAKEKEAFAKMVQEAEDELAEAEGG